jgi:hypothetical protein
MALRALLQVWEDEEARGTSGGTSSRFYGNQRVEDHALHEYLLRLEVHSRALADARVV